MSRRISYLLSNYCEILCFAFLVANGKTDSPGLEFLVVP